MNVFLALAILALAILALGVLIGQWIQKRDNKKTAVISNAQFCKIVAAEIAKNMKEEGRRD